MESSATRARTVPCDQFLQSLVNSGLLTPAQVQRLAGNSDTRRLAQHLVGQNKLTRYQAARLLQGKSVTLGGCLIQDELGKGGMGVVYKAQHRGLQRQVALKAILPDVTKKETALKRFRREVQAVSKLHHANLVAALDSGEDRGVHFLVMEYIDGRDLAQQVKKDGVLPVSQAVDTVLQAARGLACAHEAGIIHRDIKPSNLMRDAAGVVKVLDLGLARVAKQGSQSGNETCCDQLTKTGSLMGTSDYMAPEQALNVKSADHRADIYSLGCTLYYLLAAKSIYVGDTAMEKVFAHQENPIPRLPGASRALQAVFQRMVAKNPEDRYQSMGDVVEALQAGAVIRRRPWWIAGAAAAAVLALAVGSYFLIPPADAPVPATAPPAERMAYRPPTTAPDGFRLNQRPAQAGQAGKEVDVVIWKAEPAKEGQRDLVVDKPKEARDLLDKQLKELEKQRLDKRGKEMKALESLLDEKAKVADPQGLGGKPRPPG